MQVDVISFDFSLVRFHFEHKFENENYNKKTDVRNSLHSNDIIIVLSTKWPTNSSQAKPNQLMTENKSKRHSLKTLMAKTHIFCRNLCLKSPKDISYFRCARLRLQSAQSTQKYTQNNTVNEFVWIFDMKLRTYLLLKRVHSTAKWFSFFIGIWKKMKKKTMHRRILLNEMK